MTPNNPYGKTKIFVVQMLNRRLFYLGTSILMGLIPVDTLVNTHVEFPINLCPSNSAVGKGTAMTILGNDYITIDGTWAIIFPCYGQLPAYKQYVHRYSYLLRR